jgi:hypothetical protein
VIGDKGLAAADRDSDCLGKLPDNQTSFGNAYYQINFRDRCQHGIYGRFYHFSLQDAVDIGEYRVFWNDLVALAAEYHLYPKYKRTFHEVFREERAGRGEYLLKKMGVVAESGVFSMSSDEWAIARKSDYGCIGRNRD